MKIKNSLPILFTFIVLCTSCGRHQYNQLRTRLSRSNCYHNTAYNYSSEKLPKEALLTHLDTTLSNNFSFQSLHAANAIGVLTDLVSYAELLEAYRKNRSTENRLRILEKTQSINQQINIASIEISAVASELDCEEERADQIATFLKNREGSTETKLTVGAIVVGAVGTISTAILVKQGNNGTLADDIGISASLIGTALGALVLFNEKKMEFYHERNPIAEIWNASDTSIFFPPSLWYYLNFNNPQQKGVSFRKQLIEKWVLLGQMDSPDKEDSDNNKLLLGNGGKYTADQLDNRSNMLDQIEAQISVMKQDLKLLALELEEFKNNKLQ